MATFGTKKVHSELYHFSRSSTVSWWWCPAFTFQFSQNCENLFTKRCTHETIYTHVEWGIDGQTKITYINGNNCPSRKWSQIVFGAKVEMRQSGDFVNVHGDSGKMAKNKSQNDDKENDGQFVFCLSPIFISGVVRRIITFLGFFIRRRSKMEKNIYFFWLTYLPIKCQ